MKTMCPPGYHHNGFVATHALEHMMYGIYVCMYVCVCLCILYYMYLFYMYYRAYYIDKLI